MRKSPAPQLRNKTGGRGVHHHRPGLFSLQKFRQVVGIVSVGFLPPLLPAGPLARARARAFAQAVACDIHPVQNLKVLNRLAALGVDQEARTAWAREVIAEGLAACEALDAGSGGGPFCFGAAPSLADLCLVPQLYNARRFGVDLSAVPRLLSVEAACAELPAFQAAAPERQPDAE